MAPERSIAPSDVRSGLRPPGRTIAAISSPPGAGTRGVVRMSGPDAGAILARCVRVDGAAFDAASARGPFPGRFDDGAGEQPVLVLWMPGPASFTREDVAELHLVGSPPLLARALERLVELGADVAGRGEFTRRAFESGRIDLSRAEGVLELVEADGEAERRAAAELLFGGLAERVAPLRDALDDLRSLCEASLDFDEDDAGHVPLPQLMELFEQVETGLDEALGWETRRTRTRGVPRIALAGSPNAGKSSLFNALVGEAGGALVADHAGTTRDVLEAAWRVGDVEVLLLDGPGVERGASDAERRAQELAGRERRAADVVLWVVDASSNEPATTPPDGARPILVWNKIDLAGAAPEPPAELRERAASWVTVSAASGAGLGELAGRVRERVARSGGGVGREIGARHRDALVVARRESASAREQLSAGAPLDFVAEGLRSATAALDGIFGETTPEDLLDRIFARFCLGK